MPPKVVALSSILAVIGGSALFHRSFATRDFAHQAHIVQITTASGAIKASFFIGLPKDPRFSNGRNPYTEVVSEPPCTRSLRTLQSLQHLTTRVGRALGLTSVVHAQDVCANCYQGLGHETCPAGCEDGSYFPVTSSDTCCQGSAFSGFSCGYNVCPENSYYTCDNSNCPCGC